MMNTERLLKHAIQERLPITICINKIDRLILELKIPPADAYAKLKFTLDQINNLVQTFGEEGVPLFSPLMGNVIFASARFSLCFSLESFAQVYSSKHRESLFEIFNQSNQKSLGDLDMKKFASRLWGDQFYVTYLLLVKLFICQLSLHRPL